MAFAERSPAMAGSAVLHAGLAAAALLSFPVAKEAAKLQTAIPVTIIAAAPAAELRPAVEADDPREAAVETPVPDASPEPPAAVQAPEPSPAPPPPAPAPKPAPTPPAPKPAAKPEPRPAPPKPTPPRPAPPKPATSKPAPAAPKPAPTKPAPPAAKPTAAKPAASKPAAAAARPAAKPADGDDFLAALSSDLAKAAGPAHSSAPKGAAQPRTAPAAARGSGGSSADLLGPVVSRIQRGWNPNCGVPGADAIRVRVRFSLTPEGALARQPELLDGQNPSGSSLEDVAAARALRAINAAAPFSELPADRYDEWRSFTANFNAKQACANR